LRFPVRGLETWAQRNNVDPEASLIAAAAVLFAFGRMLFMLQHWYSAAGRPVGCTLTFYPTMGILLGALWMTI